MATRNSYYQGLEFGKKIYLNNLEKYGVNEGIYREIVIKNCRNYSRNFELRKTKNGKVLTRQNRFFYKGVADYLSSPNRVVF